MDNDNYGFRDDDERKAFYIALPVLALFAGLLYYFMSVPDKVVVVSTTDAFVDSDADGIADHIDRCANEHGTLDNQGCLTPLSKQNEEPAQTTSRSSTERSQVRVQEIVSEANTTEQPETLKAVELIEPAVTSDTFVSNTIARTEPEPVDSDGDGIPDNLDQCPELTGADNGCPADNDGDGLPDAQDDCPDTAGTSNGCPDKDADGIPDDNDECPDTVGTDNGCPADQDADGVPDAQDDCPDIAGTSNGCPDKDADGVPDDDDDCPTTAGTDNGCPADLDGDGVPDTTDACPETAGTDKGCPKDSDADGIADVNDDCPDIAGNNKGCPTDNNVISLAKDTDLDGIADADDKCPDIAGSAENAGCPGSTEITLTPEQPVTESEERLIQDAGFNIQFNAGNSILTGRSREILLEVANVMERYPDLRLEAHGFTDAEGAAQANKNLSQQRAQSCINVIIEAGIDSDRLKAIGFGEERPIASNNTAIGRQKNRRVEFKLIR